MQWQKNSSHLLECDQVFHLIKKIIFLGVHKYFSPKYALSNFARHTWKVCVKLQLQIVGNDFTKFGLLYM